MVDIMCVEFGGKQIKKILLLGQSSNTLDGKCESRLPPIKTICPDKSTMDGTNCLKNYVSNVGPLNQPFLVQSYTVLTGPPWIHSLNEGRGGRKVPSALPVNITLIEDFE